MQYLVLRLVSGEQHLFRACFSTLGCWVFAPFLGILLLGCGPCAFVPLYLRIFGQLGLCTTSLKRFFFDRTGSCLRFLFFRFSFFVFLFPFFLFSSSFFLFSFFFLPSVPFLSSFLHFCYVTWFAYLRTTLPWVRMEYLPRWVERLPRWGVEWSPRWVERLPRWGVE